MTVSNLLTERLIATKQSENKNRFFLGKFFLTFYLLLSAQIS